ncbi:MAG: hypothetical protein H7242_08090 [Microbacteriaceae bacterium]|nr:hypothetical protein [Burkholderiaceae bacterium]
MRRAASAEVNATAPQSAAVTGLSWHVRMPAEIGPAAANCDTAQDGSSVLQVELGRLLTVCGSATKVVAEVRQPSVVVWLRIASACAVPVAVSLAMASIHGLNLSPASA